MNVSTDMIVKLLEPQSDGTLAVMVRTYRWDRTAYVGKNGPPMINETKVPVRPAQDGETSEEYYDPRTLKLLKVARL